MTVSEQLEKLMEYATLDGTEWGEMMECLKSLYEYRGYISDELALSLEADIEANYEYAINNLKIVETKTTSTRIVKTLEHL